MKLTCFLISLISLNTQSQVSQVIVKIASSPSPKINELSFILIISTPRELSQTLQSACFASVYPHEPGGPVLLEVTYLVGSQLHMLNI